ncbi:MAG: DUF2905 domain-containing protein [Nitrospira sp.]|nr:DUF2905 domain-containing protein [Nitrospira sp.]
MQEWNGLGKWLLVAGGLLALLGAFLLVLGKWSTEGSPGWLSWVGKLPGDILIKRGHVTFYFPLATSLLLSLLVSLVLYLLSKR